MGNLRKNIMIGTAGHVDHGKTALVKMLTGCETDTLAEEKQRGLTIDLGFAPCRLAGERLVGLVDVPGHVDFIRNMVAGAHGIDIVIFVVAADDGIMPQTHEHLHILTLMGLKHGLVALTKIDLVDPARKQAVQDELRSLLAGTFLESAPIFPMSNVTGEGFGEFFDGLNEIVNACEDRSSAGIFKLWVEDSFTIRGSGTVITGIPIRGAVQVGDELSLLPAGLSGHVRRMQVYGEESKVGRAGECVAINIPEIEHTAVRRGMVLTQAGAITDVSMAEGDLQVLASIKGGIKDYTEVQFHVGTAAVSAHLALLEKSELAAGEKGMVQLRLSEPLPLSPGERFVVRANTPTSGASGLVTIGGGRILGTSNVRLRRKKEWTIYQLNARAKAINDPLCWCECMLAESGEPITTTALQPKCLLRLEEVEELLNRLSASNRAVKTPSGAYLHCTTIEETSTKVLASLETFHKSNPQRAGLNRGELLGISGKNGEVLDLALRSLLKSQKIEFNGTVYALPGSSTALPEAQKSVFDQVSSAFEKAGWVSPAPAELASVLNQPIAEIAKTVRLLSERGILIKLDENIWMHRQAIESAKQVVLGLFRRKTTFLTMEFRDALGVSRKYAVPLLDYLDKVRFTVRTGNQRTPGVEAKKLLSPGKA